MGLKRGIEKAVDGSSRIKAQSKEVAGKEDIARVGTVVSREREIGDVIADAIEKVGKDGVVNVEEGQTFGLELEFTEGMQFDKGYLSPYMITDPERMEAELEEPYVLHREPEDRRGQGHPPGARAGHPGRQAAAHRTEDVEGESLATIVVHKLRGTFTAVVKAPGFGDRRKRMLEDIAITGGEVITEEMGLKLENTKLSQLGKARKIVIDKDTTTIIDGAGETDAIKGRIKQLKQEIENTDSDFDREKLQERLAKLSGGVAVVKVGAATEVEIKEKKHRVEDALKATRAALEEGIGSGGGVALLNASATVSKVLGQLEGEEDRRGDHLPRGRGAAPSSPTTRASRAPSSSTRSAAPRGEGLNVETGEIEDLVKSGSSTRPWSPARRSRTPPRSRRTSSRPRRSSPRCRRSSRRCRRACPAAGWTSRS